MGNAILATLPAGTILQPPSTEDARRLQTLFETAPAPAGGLRLISPLLLATPAWLAERDARELDLLEVNARLQIENQTLRLRK